MAASLLIATVFWLSVKLEFQYQAVMPLEVVVENIPSGMAVRTPVPHNLHLSIRGEGWQLVSLLMSGPLRYSINAGSPMSRARPVSRNDIAERISLSRGIQVLDLIPDSLRVELDVYEEKKVPVIPDIHFAFGEMFGQVGKAGILPDSVIIGGAGSLVRQIGFWRTQRQEFSNVRAPIDMIVPLADTSVYRLSFYPSIVSLHIDVQPVAEKTISGLPVEVMDLPEGVEVILIPPRVEVVARGGITQLSNLNPGEVRIQALYGDIAGDTTGMISTRILLPEGLQLVTKRPEHLQYVIRKRGRTSSTS